MKKEKPIVVYGAIASNFVVAALKYVVAFITGSSAMLSEALHSTADTGNELLLLLGLHQSQKPADQMHPFGHGREIYFWSLIVAIVLFGIGAGMSVYEGITSLLHPTRLENPLWNYLVLAGAAIAESASQVLTIRKIRKEKEPDETIWQSLSRSKDPSIYIVFGENTAALAGLLVAFLGVFLGAQFHSHYPDAIASIVIGLILAVVAIYLIYQSKSLLVGETADLELVSDVERLVQTHPAVEKAARPMSVQLSPEEVFLALDIQFKPDLPASELIKVVDELESKIHQQHPSVGRIFIETERLKQTDHKRNHQ
jgi:cation diffusion facilitator family transporter